MNDPSNDRGGIHTEKLHVLHWNVHSWKDQIGAPNADTVVRVLSDLRPEIATLVEVDQGSGSPGALDELAAACGYSAVFVPTFEYGHRHPHGAFGNALLTTMPILQVRHWLLTWPPRIYDGTESSETRTITLVRVRSAGSEIWVGSTHLPRADAMARDRALNHLVGLTRHLAPPWMICGDFNTPASTWATRHESTTVHPNPPQPTYPSEHPVEPIDYCVASPGTVATARVLTYDGSDHRPVMFSCQLAPQDNG